MKRNTITMVKNWLLIATLGGVSLLVGGGCNCININIGGIPTTYPATAPVRSVGPPAGGNFLPVQASLASSSIPLTVCNPPQPVSGSYAWFYPDRTPPAGYAGFQGYVKNKKTGAIIPNSDYYLQWFVNSNNNGCCTPVPGGTEVSCPVTPGLAYYFKAYFKVGVVPPPGPFLLEGAWTDSEVDQ